MNEPHEHEDEDARSHQGTTRGRRQHPEHCKDYNNSSSNNNLISSFAQG